MSELVLRTIPNGRWLENCYLLGDPATDEAVLVDPGEEPGRALAALRHAGLRLREVWLTHGHVDHVLGVGAVQEATGAPIRLHPDDRFLYDEAVEWADPPGSVAALPPPDAGFADGDRVACGRFEFRVRHLPGHSPGHVVFVGHGLVLGGDVLFDGSIGRTDLPGGDPAALIDGIRRILLPLPADTIVYPGHGRPTTIGAERETNPFLDPVRSRA